MNNPTTNPSSLPPTPHSPRLTIGLYAAVVFLYWMSLYLYVPTLPTYAESKTDTLAMVGLVIAQYGIWQAFIRFPLGIASDWVGRHKPFIVGGFALAGLGALVMGTANSVDGLAVGRAITGLAAGTWVVLVVGFSSLFPPREAVRASALLTFIGSAGRVLATGVTGWLNGLGGYPLAFFAATGAAALAILVALLTKEQHRPPKPPSLKDLVQISLRRDVLLPSLIAAASQYANWATTFGFTPILAKGLGATDVALSMLTSMNIGVVIAGNLAAATISKRIDARWMTAIAFMLMAVGIVEIALAHSLLPLFLAQFCIGLAQGVSNPVLMGLSIRFVEEERRATAMGLHQAVYAVGMFTGPWLSGLLADEVGIPPMYWATAAVCLVVGLLAAWLLAAKQADE
ncbi:MAG: MFS transporter [Anaerolineae bacterium]|nr:MFS transporter [Anaerolineae bacterium]